MGELVGSENPFVPIPQRTDLDDSKSRAKKFVAQIESEIAKLKKYPKRCTLINESEFLGIEYRHFVIENYRIIFKSDTENIFIMRVIHGSRILNL